MASLSLVLAYVVVLILLNSKRTLPSRLARSLTQVSQIGADDYPSSGRNTPVHDLGFPNFPSFQEVVAVSPPPPDMPLFPPPPSFPDLERPIVTVPASPSLPDFPPFPFVDQTPPSEPFGPGYDESDWMPSTPSNSDEYP